MPKLAIFNISAAFKGVDQIAVFSFCHRIDGQVPALQILLKGDVGRAVNSEAVVAAPLFPLGASQGIFFPGSGMQKYREVRAHLLEAVG